MDRSAHNYRAYIHTYILISTPIDSYIRYINPHTWPLQPSYKGSATVYVYRIRYICLKTSVVNVQTPNISIDTFIHTKHFGRSETHTTRHRLCLRICAQRNDRNEPARAHPSASLLLHLHLQASPSPLPSPCVFIHARPIQHRILVVQGSRQFKVVHRFP